jgi:pimeloyl-ACP methyl ester carboxylesterase
MPNALNGAPILKTKYLLPFFALWMLAALCSARAADEAIVLETPTGKLAGSLLMPARSGRMPVALIIAGSGPTDRDGNNSLLKGANDSLKMLAQALADGSYASVRYDKRGIGASAAAMWSEADLRFDTYVDDAAAWIDKLAHDPRFSSVVVIGHSEGSLIGMVAARKGKANGFISLAGAGSAAYDVLRRQLAGRLPGELAAANERILTALQHGEKSEPVPPALTALYRPSVQPYLMSYFKYVP